MSVIGPVTITYLQMSEFKRLYDKGTWPNQRFGQAFCNHFNITDANIFYEKYRKLAEDFIYQTLVK